MWKYVSRRIKDTIERGAGYFDARSAASAGVTRGEGAERRSEVPCRWISERRCFKGRTGGDGANRNWYFNYLNQSWLGAITWSSALALGWYASQLIHLKKKYRTRERHSLCTIIQRNIPVGQLFCAKSVKSVVKESPFENFENGKPRFVPVELVSNENSSRTSSATSSAGSNDLSDILNSIENRLGLAAIENGQHQDGLSMLRSAANRHHPPALYNLGLCYELGLGVKSDEKMAMEFYRIAATLEHPGALYNLALYYGQGRGGLSRDLDMATRLLRLAALKGQVNAIDALKALESEENTQVMRQTPVERKEENWLKPAIWETYDGPRRDLMPSQTSLFVEQIQAFRGNEFKCEPTVY